jgi:hypothetical protein
MVVFIEWRHLMLARTPPWSPWAPRTPEADAAFATEVEAIKAAARARRAKLAADRASFWERATSDVQWDHDREAWRNGEGEV